jgi:hypothetical protein
MDAPATRIPEIHFDYDEERGRKRIGAVAIRAWAQANE